MTIRVLLVDDQALIRAGLAALLNAEPDIEVVGEAADGVVAVASARALRPDVVLMDISMPGMSGVEAGGLIVTESGGQSAVLILTTFDLDEHVYAALTAGASGFLLKDAPPEELIAAVRVVARGDALIAPHITKRLIGRFAANQRAVGQATSRLAELTERELEVVMMVGQGLDNKQIARQLFISESTAKTHLNRAMVKLELSSRAQIVAAAYSAGLVTPGAVDN
ncbi:response regulator [Nocardia altamirensis]|uniref:response regulator n=1 Tax=Nocardia altamirensis TaxID=472158 RepID=UPI0008401976|nr:response regulator transcription factor [Nocardia altamirensis]